MNSRRALAIPAGIIAVAVVLAIIVYVRVEREQLDLTTGLLLMASVFMTVLGLAELLSQLVRALPGTRVNVRMLTVTTFVCLVALELTLRFGVGTYKTYLEKNGPPGGPYHLQYHSRSPTWFHVYTPSVEYTPVRPEFAYPRKMSSLGIPEREIPLEKAPNEYRIIALGDSYTEGVGAPYEETWIKVAERRLASAMAGRTPVAFNAGVSGSDPWYEYILLREKLLVYKPDLVIVAINTTDITDLILRGGQERFQPDGTTRISRQPPSWEWLYGISYLSRHVIHDVLHYNWLLIRQSAWNTEQQTAARDLVAAVTAFTTLGRERGFRVVIVAHPDHFEGVEQKYEYPFSTVVDTLKQRTDLDVVDVLDSWKSTGVLAHGASALYWTIDGHNNSKGYAAFGEAVVNGILRKGPTIGE